MGYLKKSRSQIILACFLLFSLVVALVPAIDLDISRLFYHGGFPRDQWWQSFLHDTLNWFLCLSLGSVLACYALNKILKRNFFNVDGRRVTYLFAVLIIGAGLIVNWTLKDNFGRARPRDVAEFGGHKTFTPAFVISRECRTNCSFSSGDAAGGFFSIALVFALARRSRVALVAGLAVGIIESMARISSGAHFFSDTGVSFFVMLITADVLFFYIVMTAAERAAPRTGKEPAPGYAEAVADPVAEPRTGNLPGL